MHNVWVLGGKPRIETINLAKITITFFLRICSCVDFIVNCSEQSTETPKARISGSKKRRMMAIPQQNRKVQGYKKSSKIIKTPTQKDHENMRGSTARYQENHVSTQRCTMYHPIMDSVNVSRVMRARAADVLKSANVTTSGHTHESVTSS